LNQNRWLVMDVNIGKLQMLDESALILALYVEMVVTLIYSQTKNLKI